MTLMDEIKMADSNLFSQKSNISSALKQTLKLAVEESRLENGTIQCADVLSIAPEIVSLCILPVGEDVAMLIQHKLIQAYCWEYDIPVLKVDSAEKLRKVLTSGDENNNGQDFSCVVVKNKTNCLSSAEVTLANYYADLIKRDVDPHPVIDLPI